MPITNHTAIHPFRFFSCLELRRVLGVRAMDEQRLLELIEEVPADSIYYHTHSYYLRYSFSQGQFPNDFATWAAIQVQDRVLAERLGLLDPFQYDDIEALREALLTILGDHLSGMKTVPHCSTGVPFEFLSSHMIESDLGITVETLQEFRDALARVDIGSVYNHVCEARLRKGHPNGDFADWLSSPSGLAMPDLADRLVEVNHLGLSLENMRLKFVRLCDEVLRPQVMEMPGRAS